MKRVVSLILAAALAAGVLTGCGAAEQSTVSEVEKETGFTPSMDTSATVDLDFRGTWGNFEALEAVVADWNEIYPNVSVTYTRVDEYNKHLVDILTSDDRPDLVVYSPKVYYADKEKVEENLVDLNTLGLDTSVYNEGALALSMSGDKMVTLSWGMQTSGFLVNKTLLEKLGLEIPQTHEEFETVCAALREAGYTPLQGCYINIAGNILKNDSNLRLASEKDQEALYQKFANVEPGCGSYFAPEYETMFTLLQNEDLDHELDKSIENIYEESILHFFEGNTPFFCTVAETVSGMKKRETKSEAYTANPFEYTFVSLPVENETPTLSVSALLGVSLVSDSENEEWGAEFLRFLCSEEELNKMAQVKGVPSLTRNSSTDPRFVDIGTVPAENRINEGEYPVIDLISSSLDNALWDIMEGNATTVDEAAASFEEHLSGYVNSASTE